MPTYYNLLPYDKIQIVREMPKELCECQLALDGMRVIDPVCTCGEQG